MRSSTLFVQSGFLGTVICCTMRLVLIGGSQPWTIAVHGLERSPGRQRRSVSGFPPPRFALTAQTSTVVTTVALLPPGMVCTFDVKTNGVGLSTNPAAKFAAV